MTSERFQEFPTAHCNLDEDPADLAVRMHGTLGAYARPWLLPELDATIADGSLLPDEAEYLTLRRFDSPQEVTAWLRDLRTAWYGHVEG